MQQTEAEKAGRKLASEAGMDIVTIHPAFVLGPVLSRRTDATSVSKFKASALAAPFGCGTHVPHPRVAVPVSCPLQHRASGSAVHVGVACSVLRHAQRPQLVGGNGQCRTLAF